MLIIENIDSYEDAERCILQKDINTLTEMM